MFISGWICLCKVNINTVKYVCSKHLREEPHFFFLLKAGSENAVLQNKLFFLKTGLCLIEVAFKRGLTSLK